MPTLGAIDIGSNAMRMAVGFLDARKQLQVVEDLREPVRLGQDVFTRGTLSRATVSRMIQALIRFRVVLEAHRVEKTRAVATSALREAKNREAVLKRIRQATGLEIDLISPEEEALLVQMAVSEKIPLWNRTALLVDVGGGSVEVTLVKHGRIAATESFHMGSVRLLKILEGEKTGERKFNRMVQEYAEAARRRIQEKFGKRPVDLCVGTGGNLDALGDLRLQLLHGPDSASFSRKDLGELVRRLQRSTLNDRISRLHMRPDRADVILPAALVVQKLMEAAKVRRVLTPHVGLKEGILRNLVPEFLTGRPATHRAEILTSAAQLGQRYRYDEPNADRVARYAMELFDKTRKLHRLEEDDRLLLEVAAKLHDIGQYVNYGSHHKHSYYLIRASHLVGLNVQQEELVANVARYHRKSPPKMKHDNYRTLAPSLRSRVIRMSALLRVADAMDYEHAGKVQSFRVETGPRRFSLRLHGTGDLALEKWSLLRKCDLFEKTFKTHLTVKG